jgi:putative tryptophan/tyrosine transport system substrate-binding protein
MVVPETTVAQVRAVFDAGKNKPLDAIVVSPSGEFIGNLELIVDLVRRRKLPAMYPYREYVEIGGLMAYAPDLPDPARHLAKQVHDILQGQHPGEIPIYQAIKFDLILNQKTAESLDLTFSPIFVANAAEVIE